MLLAFKRIKLIISKRCLTTETLPCNFSENILSRKVGLTNNEQTKLKKLSPEDIPDPHSLIVSVIGLPNSGKSTFVNSLNKWRITAVSKKVHTTRKNIVSNFTDGSTQIVLLDTPGLISRRHCKKHGLDDNMVTCPHDATSQSDMIAVVVDSLNPWTRNYLDPITLLHLQENASKPSILILNKVDMIKSKAVLLEIMRTLTGAECGGQHLHFTTEPATSQTPRGGTEVMDNLERLREERLAKELRRLDPGTAPPPSPKGELPHDPQNSLVYKNYPHESLTPHVTAHASELALYDGKGAQQVKLRNTWPNFGEVFMVSSTTNDGIDDVRRYLVSSALPKRWIYNGSFVTDQMPEEIVKDTIREELLNEFEYQIPYILGIKIIIGPKGDRIRKISQNVSQNLMNTFRADLYLSIAVKFRPKSERR